MKKSTEQNLTPWGGWGVTGFMAVLLAIVQHSEERWAAEPSLQASSRLSVVFTLHASILNCTTFFASSITIITNHRGWKTLPVCVCWFAEGTFLSRPGRKWEAPRRREGPHNRLPERFEEGTTGEPRPLLSPGPWWCLRGHMDACLCAPSHQPILHPPPPPYTPPPPSVTGPSTWMSHGRSDVELTSADGNRLNLFFLFPLSPNIQNICIAVHPLSQSSLFPFKES